MKKILLMFSLILVAVIFGHETMAQYGGYGGGYGGYGGGYGRGRINTPDFNSAPRKAPTIDQEADNELKWLKKKLKLTEDQIVDADFIVMDNTIKRFDLKDEAVKAAANESKRKEVITKFKEDILKLQADKEAKFHKLFTPEQWTIFEEKKKAMPNYIDAASFQ